MLVERDELFEQEGYDVHVLCFDCVVVGPMVEPSNEVVLIAGDAARKGYAVRS